MSLRSLKDLYLIELAELCDVEAQMMRALPRLADAARAPELRDALRRHADESHLHLERLQLALTHWGERLSPRACHAVAGIVQQADDRVHDAETPDVRDAAIVGAAQRIEHYEIAAYGCARTYADRLNRSDEARLLQETLDEEARTDRRLTVLAETHINDDARSERDLHERPRRSDLKYVPAGELADRRLPAGGVEVRNDAGDDLGRLDGFIVDPSRRPRYIVVGPHGLFTRRRYLVPVPHVRFDARAKAFRVDLSKDVFDRYPTFEPDAFEEMNDSGWHGYERSVLAFFPAAAGDSLSQPEISEAAPEWLLSGVWMTVPPETAERLPEEARTYVNEFDPTSTGEDAAARPEPGRRQGGK